MNPIIIIILLLVFISGLFTLAYVLMKNKKESLGFERHVSNKEIISKLLVYAKPYKAKFVLIFSLVVVSIAADIILPLIIGDVSKVLGTPNFAYAEVFNRVMLYAILLLISMIALYIQAMMLEKTGQKICSKIRIDTFTHIEGLSAQQLSEIPVGSLVTRVSNDIASIERFFTSTITNLTKNIFKLIGVTIAMFCVNVKIAFVIICFFPFVVYFTTLFSKFSRKAYREVKTSVTNVNTFLSENLSGIKITQIFNQEEKKQRDFEKLNKKLNDANLKEIAVFAAFRPSIYMLYVLTIIAMFFIAATSAIDHVVVFNQEITYSTIIIFYQFIGIYYEPVQNLAEQFNSLQSAFASAEKIFNVLSIVPTIVDSEDAIELDTINGEIEFKNVWFYYVKDEWVLKDVSFKVNAKETVALVGSTGSGKSTILSLIVRNYDIQKGQILIDGIDIKKIKLSSLRKHFGQMLQDVFIFSGTIRSNIILREENISEEEIKHACDYVNASHFINQLEHGLDEEVLERGNNFSAGQRQLLSFARTIVHKPEVMILDEATANIDTETEQLIQNSLEKMMNIGTMIMVAHRLSTIQHADNIIVLSRGQIIEQGNHHELLKKKGKYYKLYQIQYSKEALKSR